MIDFEPTEEQALIVDTVRQFAKNEVRPRAREADESAKTPARACSARAHELGLVANALPEASGGGGARSAVTGALIAEELACGDLALALAILSPSLLGVPGRGLRHRRRSRRRCSRADRERELRAGLARAGGAALRLRSVPARSTTARRDGDDWVLDGAKCFVPWLEGGEHVLVLAREGDALAGFLVPRDATGLRADARAQHGHPRAADRRARARRRARAGGRRGSAAPTAPTCARSCAAAASGSRRLAVGVARAAFELARDYAKERQAFGAPIATKQAIAFKLADMAIEIDGARLLAWEAAWRLDSGARRDARGARSRRHQVRRVALEVADGAVQVFGGHGYIREYLPEMHAAQRARLRLLRSAHAGRRGAP